MKFIKMDPPGQFCLLEALLEMVRNTGAKTFVEVGCGSGDVSLRLLNEGLTGIGYDFSPEAIQIAEKQLSKYISTGHYRLINSDLLDSESHEKKMDLALCLMVVEHVEDDVGFIRKIRNSVKEGGHVIIGVPGRKDRWSIEDDTVGHLRRYDRQDLIERLAQAELENLQVWSIGVPVANLLFRVSNFAIGHSKEVSKLKESQRRQTETSGIREIPFKTIFPSIFKLVLNRTALFPVLMAQRIFYKSNLGLTMLGVGRVPENTDG